MKRGDRVLIYGLVRVSSVSGSGLFNGCPGTVLTPRWNHQFLQAHACAEHSPASLPPQAARPTCTPRLACSKEGDVSWAWAELGLQVSQGAEPMSPSHTVPHPQLNRWGLLLIFHLISFTSFPTETAFLEAPRHPTATKEMAKKPSTVPTPGKCWRGNWQRNVFPRRREENDASSSGTAVFARRAVPLADSLLKNGSLKIALHLELCLEA